MRLPISIPNWIKFKQKLYENGIDFNISGNTINGAYHGHFTVINKNFKFKMKIYNNNLILSFKSETEETNYIVRVLEKIFNQNYVIKYYANGNTFPYNYEWYWGCSIEKVKKEIDRIKNLDCYKVFAVNIPKEIKELEEFQ